MFKITPIQGIVEQKKCAEECGIPVREGFFAYEMLDVDTQELMGMAQFEIGDGVGYIADLIPRIDYDDFEAMFILARATMNFIDTCGAHICRAPLTASDATLMRAIGFKEAGGEYVADMTHFFDGSCHSH